MSRSAHTTRRDIEDVKRADYADAAQRAVELHRLREQLTRKRRTKHRSTLDRRHTDDPLPPTSPESIGITVGDSSDLVHYPASPDDVLAVMRLLPKGVIDGLTSIVMELGSQEQEKHADCHLYNDERDPFTGRLGYQVLPGVFSGRTQGVYRCSSGAIRIFAHVYDPVMLDCRVWEVYLRLSMLSTFAHELAHHYDYTMRTARGRWLMDHEAKAEVYAEAVQHDWIQNCIVPYLQRSYPGQVKALEEWIAHFGGASMPLSELAGDPRSTLKNGLINVQRACFDVSSAVTCLAASVRDGLEPLQTHVEFARELHYGERYDPALRALERVLSDRSDHMPALTLKADIYEHQGMYGQARELAEHVVCLDAGFRDAWWVLTDVYEATSEWRLLLDAADRILRQFELSLPDKAHAGFHRARANLELGNRTEADADLRAIAALDWRSGSPPRYVQRRISELEKESRGTSRKD